VKAALLKIVFVGHVDHGKSTLIGRILEETGSLPEGKIDALRAGCEAQGQRFEYAFLLDALAEEQQQNVTIDTTQIHFRTADRDYVIIDAPGHEVLQEVPVVGAHLDHPAGRAEAEPLARLIEQEKPTCAGAVPTIWTELLHYAEANPVDLSSLNRVLCGGSAVPRALIERFEEQFGVRLEFPMTNDGQLVAFEKHFQ
jgi:hypothetical protein